MYLRSASLTGNRRLSTSSRERDWTIFRVVSIARRAASAASAPGVSRAAVADLRCPLSRGALSAEVAGLPGLAGLAGRSPWPGCAARAAGAALPGLTA